MCTTRHFAIALALTMIPEEMQIAFMILSDVVKGKYGAYCKNKCGMNVRKAMKTELTDSQIKSMLAGKKTFVQGIKGKKGLYEAYLIPEGLEDYCYTKDGKEINGTQYKVRLEFPQSKK